MERLTHDVACIDLLHAKFAYTAAAPYLRNYNTQKHNKDLGCYLKVSCGTLNSSSSSFNATLFTWAMKNLLWIWLLDHFISM